jgi:hypothetical protein
VVQLLHRGICIIAQGSLFTVAYAVSLASGARWHLWGWATALELMHSATGVCTGVAVHAGLARTCCVSNWKKLAICLCIPSLLLYVTCCVSCWWVLQSERALNTGRVFSQLQAMWLMCMCLLVKVTWLVRQQHVTGLIRL